jgi:hypothetical protein
VTTCVTRVCCPSRPQSCVGFTCPAGTTIPKVPPPGGFTSPPNVTDCCTAVFNCSSVTCGAGTIKNETAGNFLSPPTQAQCCVPVYNCAADVCGTSGFPKNPQPVNSLTPVGFNECCNVSGVGGRRGACAAFVRRVQAQSARCSSFVVACRKQPPNWRGFLAPMHTCVPFTHTLADALPAPCTPPPPCPAAPPTTLCSCS